MSFVIARKVELFRGSAPALVLPADPQRLRVILKASFLPVYIADRAETLSSDIGAQHAFLLSTFHEPTVLERYTGALWVRSELMIPSTVTKFKLSVLAISKGK